MNDKPQIHSVEGLSPEQVAQALKDGRLRDYLAGVEGDGRHEEVEQRDAAWLAAATGNEVVNALKAGELRDLLGDEGT